MCRAPAPWAEPSPAHPGKLVVRWDHRYWLNGGEGHSRRPCAPPGAPREPDEGASGPGGRRSERAPSLRTPHTGLRAAAGPAPAALKQREAAQQEDPRAQVRGPTGRPSARTGRPTMVVHLAGASGQSPPRPAWGVPAPTVTTCPSLAQGRPRPRGLAGVGQGCLLGTTADGEVGGHPQLSKPPSLGLDVPPTTRASRPPSRRKHMSTPLSSRLFSPRP